MEPPELHLKFLFYTLASQLYFRRCKDRNLNLHMPQSPKHMQTSSINSFWFFFFYHLKATEKETKAETDRNQRPIFCYERNSLPRKSFFSGGMDRTWQQLAFQIITTFDLQPICRALSCFLQHLVSCAWHLLYLHVQPVTGQFLRAVWPKQMPALLLLPCLLTVTLGLSSCYL